MVNSRAIDIETIVDAQIKRAAGYYNKTERSLKAFAVIAGNLVGKYEKYGTHALADEVHRSVSTIENYAHAKWMYDVIRREEEDVYPFCVFRQLWRELPTSHWWLAWDEIHKRGGTAIHYLIMAHQNNWSGRDMVKEYRADYEATYGSPPPVTAARHLQRARGIVEHILVNMDSFDAAIVEWARMGLNLIGGQAE